MPIRSDPECNESRALFEMADFTGKHVLEIGCGDGRLTWRYADRSAHVTAIDPFEEGIRRAKKNLPDRLRDRVKFFPITFEDYARTTEAATWDIAILSWTL